MKCVILQPSYIPWRGYFHQIWKADCFVFLDDVQFDKRGWRNRNRIKTPCGASWLTIPVLSKGCQIQHIQNRDIKICHDSRWQTKHWQTLQLNYRKAPFFDAYAELIKEFYDAQWEFLCDMVIEMTVALSWELGIRHTRFVRSSALGVEGSKTDRLLNILKKIGASHYITGPLARAYLEEHKFSEAGITLEYMQYDYPEYAQLYGPFDGQISILDLLFMTGPGALQFITKSSPQGENQMEGASALIEVNHELS